jgi:hypothetical protein
VITKENTKTKECLNEKADGVPGVEKNSIKLRKALAHMRRKRKRRKWKI